MMNKTVKVLAVAGLAASISAPALAKVQEYNLTIDNKTINLTGKPVERIAINGTIPGKTLEFTEGDDAVVHVKNNLKTDTSVHWHGMLVPGNMDGVPGYNGYPGIKPGETFTYRFKVRQNGTYWYHSHTGPQEADGHYAPVIIHPKGGEKIKTDRDYIIMLSDFHDDDGLTTLTNLKKNSEYYIPHEKTAQKDKDVDKVVSFEDKAKKEENAGKNPDHMKMSKEMQHMMTDMSDIRDYIFLVNGKTTKQNWTGIFKPGEKIRLRFINASAMSYYDVRIPGLKMTVVAADGQPVEPVALDEFRFGVAETYDMIVEPKEDKAYTIAAESIDRTGFALGTLAPREGMRGEQPKKRKLSMLTMADMGVDNSKDDNDYKNHKITAANPTGAPVEDFDTGVKGSGWANADTPKGHKALSYKDLRYKGEQKDQRKPEREIVVRLGGDMKNYIWTMDGKPYDEHTSPINLKYGERVRLTFVNDSMMAHPMHLHGMFVQLENGQPMGKLPNKHTITVAPGDTYSALLTADEVGEWAFHCHMIYHMGSGMMMKAVVAKLDESAMPKEDAQK